jgi:hypothetical protein
VISICLFIKYFIETVFFVKDTVFILVFIILCMRSAFFVYIFVVVSVLFLFGCTSVPQVSSSGLSDSIVADCNSVFSSSVLSASSGTVNGCFDDLKLSEVDPDLISSNILSGKNIFGVVGSFVCSGVDCPVVDKNCFVSNVDCSACDFNSFVKSNHSFLNDKNSIFSSGYYDGNDLILIDGDFIARNIRSGINIFGVRGNYSCGGCSCPTCASCPVLDGNAMDENVLAGYTYYNADGSVKRTGTMPTLFLVDSSSSFLAGYYDANDLNVIDVDLNSNNILSGVTIFGVTGTASTGSSAKLHSGQTTSYDSGVLDDAALDGNAKSYTNNGNGTITDNHTGLMWQKDGTGYMSWENALSFCDSNTVGGYTDWRLPTLVELITFVDYACSAASANCTNRFINIAFNAVNWGSGVSGYWSSTTVSNDTTSAYYLNHTYGAINTYIKTGAFNTGTRCVRSP